MEGSDLKTRSVFDPYYLVIPANFHEAARRLAVTFAGRFEANEEQTVQKIKELYSLDFGLTQQGSCGTDHCPIILITGQLDLSGSPRCFNRMM